MAGYVFRPTYTDKRTGEKRQSGKWWIGYSVNGRKVREPAKTTSKRDAEALLHRRLADRVPGAPLPVALGRVRFEDLAEVIREDYKRNGRKSTGRLERSIAALSEMFEGWAVPAIDEVAVSRYVSRRQAAGFAPATINRELSALKRMLRLGYQQKLVGRTPDISMLTENNTRTGFLSRADLWGLLEVLPEELKPLVETAYVTGWRKGELLSRRWRHLDLVEEPGWLRLEPGETKSGEGRSFPLTEHLRKVLTAHRDQGNRLGANTSPEGPLFFHYDGPRKGQGIRNFEKQWRKARAAAGLPDLVFHDLRRTAVRNLVRAGIPETVAMKLSGHRTRSVFDRYAIADEAALRRAGAALDALETRS